MRHPHFLGIALALALPAPAQRSLFTIDGAAPADFFGASLRPAGDVDGDGAPDFLVGGTQTVTVVSSSTHQAIYTYTGDDGIFGYAFDGLGDVNGDGYADFAIGDIPNGSTALVSHVWVYSGQDGTLLHDLQDLDAGLDVLGYRVRGCGDLDGDGVGDLLTMGTKFRNQAQRKLLAYSGATGLELFRVDGPSSSSTAFAWAFTDLGDVNGDGVSDFAVGDENYFTFDGPTRGRVLVYSGVDRSVLYTIFGNATSYGFPELLERTGDLDGDGIDELMVAHEESSQGIVRVHSGASGTLLHSFSQTHAGSDFGSSMSRAGDMDGDGVEDFLVGAPGNLPFITNGGAVHGYSGATGQPLFTIEGEAVNGKLGSSLAAAGDLDGDGLEDILVGQPHSWSFTMLPGQVHGYAYGYGVIEIGFEQADDFETMLVNGQRVDTGEAFGERIRIRATGSHNFGAAVFDSSPTGPNQGGPDPDLLVDQGQLLILQGEPGQSSPGIFDPPTDAVGGGTLRLEWRSPAELESIDLVSLAKLDPAATVRLIDTQGRTRTYSVPSGFTGTGGVQTLDLTTLDPQPGLGQAATAEENVGFLPERVNTLEILLASTGAVDRLRYVPSGEPEVERIMAIASVPVPPGSNDFGRDFGSVGDVDGDQIQDFVYSAYQAGVGTVLLVSGASGQTLHTFVEPVSASNFGDSCSGIGDIDHDGVPDVAIGAWNEDLPGGFDQGGVYIYSGQTYQLLMELHGQSGDRLGLSLDAMGDLDGDGTDDFLVGAHGADSFRGRLEVRSGATGEALVTIPGSVPGAYLGTHSRGAGDLNADGVTDIVAYEEGGGLAQYAGRLAVFSGADGTLILEQLGTDSQQFLGYGSSAAGDVDLDGHDDVLCADRNYRDPSGSLVGRLLVLSGSDGSVLHEVIGDHPGYSFAYWTASWNDQDGDGHPDFAALGTVDPPGANPSARRLFLFSGKTGALLFERTWGDLSIPSRLEPAGDLNGDGIEELLTDVHILGSGEDRFEALSVRRINASVVCTGADNSTGIGARLYSNGRFGAHENELELTAWNLPDKALALLISSPAFTREAHPFIGGIPSSGALCLLRLPVTRHGFVKSHGGTASYDVDLSGLPGSGPGTGVLAGTTQLFQVVYRDFGAPGDTNFSDAILFTFE